MAALLAAVFATGAETDGERMDRFMQAFEAQSAQLKELAQVVEAQRSELAELRSLVKSSKSRPSASTAPGRRLQASSERGVWQQSIYHAFEDPSSSGCDLHAELHDSSVGPLMIKRKNDGYLELYYSTSTVFNLSSPIVLRHPTGCGNATLQLQMDTNVAGALSVNGEDVHAPAIHVEVNAGRSTSATTLSSSGVYIPGLEKSFTIDSESKVLIYYQTSFHQYCDTTPWCFLHTRLFLNDGTSDTELISARSLFGGENIATNLLGATNGMHVGVLSPGTYTAKVMGRSDKVVDFNPSNNQFGQGLHVVVL